MIEVGQVAPNFNLHKSKTEKVELAQLRGKTVVLSFFPAAFTGVCEAQLCSFGESHASLANLNAEVLGISVDGPFTLGAFASKNGITYSLLSDYQRETISAYGITHDDFAGISGYTASKRSVFVINKDGVVSYAWVAPNPGVQPDYAEVSRQVEALA